MMRRSPLLTTLMHVIGWLLLNSMMLAFLSLGPGSRSLGNTLFSPAYLLFIFIYPFIFYINFFILTPRLLLPKKYLLYAIILLLLFAVVYFLKPFDHLMTRGRPPEGFNPPPGNGPQGNPPPGGGGPNFDIVSIILFVLVYAVSTALVIFRQWRMTEQKALQAETDKARAELSFLKAQINPHFLFNTLNNLYSLAVMKNENMAAGILKLSNIMRYVTDDIREDFVSLEREIACITDYIDLQRLRLGKRMNVNFEVKGDKKDKKIAPLVLMTFIENAFKYGISNHEDSVITIKLEAAEKQLHFICQNRLFSNGKNGARAGIGIVNTKQRLQHLYPDKHTLLINSENEVYTVQLTLSEI
ncbi:MAG TPA: sensor histidine kinase [Chitinophagaceae bacterium]|nr:sensor histidine kinase [Chitinophagaceae bacterium]